VKAREALPFDQRHVRARAREERRGDRTRGSAAEHHHVAPGDIHHVGHG
jgi:hypothetical protein